VKKIIPVFVLIALGVILLSSINFDYGNPGARVSDYYVKHALAQTGALNIITAIYLNYRAFDTLGEATVFFATALGVFMLLRKKEEEGR